MLQIAWPPLSKIIYGLERPELILRGSKKNIKNSSDFDDINSNPSEVSAHVSRNSDGEPCSSDDIKAWGTANKHLFSVLRLTTTGAARSVLLKFEPRNDQPGNNSQLCELRIDYLIEDG